MGFLSKVNVTESPFESFYGTSTAGNEVNLSEMSEGEVNDHLDLLTDRCSSVPYDLCRCHPNTHTATSKMNVR